MNLHRCIVTFLQQYSRFETGRIYNFLYKKKISWENIVSFESTLTIQQNLLIKISNVSKYVENKLQIIYNISPINFLSQQLSLWETLLETKLHLFSPFKSRIRIKPFGALNFPRKTHSFQSMHEHSVSRLDIHYQIDAVLSSVTSSCTPTPMPALQRHSIKNHPSDSIKSRAVFIHSFSLHPSLLRHQEKRRERIR